MVHLLQEAIDVTALAAAEAVVEADLRAHVEAGAALVVERAQALHRADAGGLERHVVVDDVGDVGTAATSSMSSRLIRPAMHLV